MNFSPSSYELYSVATGSRRSDIGGWTLDFEGEPPSLLRADYAKKQLNVNKDLDGLYCFADWLPVRRTLDGSSFPASFQSQGLAAELGLKNLWITFNGWWPEKGVRMCTGTFKECEAYSVCGRIDINSGKILVVASAGNTARAFARVCSDNAIPLLLFVPEDNLSALWFDKAIADCVKLVAPASGADYFDAIRMSDVAVADSDIFLAEGGAKNIARRDGMGTSVLSAVTSMGRIPDFYFQAVGSGTGAIAAWEAAMRLEGDGRYGMNRMQLMLSQNEPFTPIADTWKVKSRDFIVPDDDMARILTAKVKAKVLTNRRPPWSLSGGLYDTLKASQGQVITVTNDESQSAARHFLQKEGKDITPEAAVATASLFKAVERGMIGANQTVMLNITGGGIKALKSQENIHYLKAHCVLPLDAKDETIAEQCHGLFQKELNRGSRSG